jgi:hypothetical protein
VINLLVTVAGTMAQLLAAIDLTDDDEVDPDVTSPWFEGVAAELDRLNDEDRRDLVGLIRRAVAQETDRVVGGCGGAPIPTVIDLGKPNSRGPGRQGRSYSGALHLDALNHAHSPGVRADSRRDGSKGWLA